MSEILARPSAFNMKWSLLTLSLIFSTLFMISHGLECVDLSDSYNHVIYVDPNNPNSANNASCYDQHLSQQIPCANISFALAFPDREKSTKFVLSSKATHHLVNNESITVFSGGSEVAFYSDSGTAVVECGGGAGLAFINTTQITFNGVSFQQCGAWRDSTSRDFTSNTFKLLQIRVGLYFYNCADVRMVNMSVLNSTEAVGVVMYSTAGINYIAYSQFNNNRISKNNKNESGGGGFAVEFNYCKPGDNSCNETNHQTENIQNTVYTFEHCSFSDNCAIDQSGHKKTGVSILPNKKTHSSLGRGGGLSVYFKAAALNNSVTIQNCFFHRNQANWGGGLSVEYADSSIQNQVIVRETEYISNRCYFRNQETGALGGGVLVSSPVHYDFKRDNLLRNYIMFFACIFIDNKAITGGALAFVYTLQRLSNQDQIFSATISNSTFSSNQARLGSAVAVDHEYFYHQGELGNMVLSDCMFHNNTIVYSDTSNPYSVGIGALYISEVQTIFQGFTEFWNNTGSALALVGTRVTFDANSSFTFAGNHGENGGAIAFLGGSSMLIGERMEMYFQENSASQFGGAIYNIYIGKEDLRSSVKCFIQYYDPFSEPKDWEARFIFEKNTAGHLGNSIFSSTILPCSWSEDFQVGPDIVSDIFCWNKSNWIYADSDCSNEIFTFPQNFTDISDISTYPGHPFRLNITAMDDLGHDVTTNTIYTALIKNSSAAAEIDPPYRYVSNGSIGVTGKEEQNVTLQLDVAWHRDWRIDVPVHLKNCPLGFDINITISTVRTSQCECIGGNEAVTFGGQLICEKAIMKSKVFNGFWVGQIPRYSNDQLVMGSSKFVLRNTTHDYIYVTDVDSQCSHLNRKGPLCGECIKNYSTAVNSYNYECVPCTSNTTNLAANIAAYVSLTYLPYLIVFIVIIAFDVKLKTGPIAGFVLYAQLISSGAFDLTIGHFPFSSNNSFATDAQKVYRIVYGVFNLNSFSKLMHPICVKENMTAPDVICLDYGIAFFPFLLAIIAILLHFCCSQICKSSSYSYEGVEGNHRTEHTKGSGVKYAAVRFLSFAYTKATLNSVLLIAYTDVINQKGDFVGLLNYYAGQYSFSDPDYLPYGVSAILILIIIGTAPPLFLVFPLPYLKRKLTCNSCICEKLVELIAFFMDAFSSYFRPNCRWFAGVYFWFRLIMLLIFALSPNPLSQVLLQFTTIILMIITVTIVKPHKETFYNYVDLFILVVMAGIASVSIYLFVAPLVLIDKPYSSYVYIFGLVLVWLPMLYLVLYVIQQCLSKCRQFLDRCNLPQINFQKKIQNFFQKLEELYTDSEPDKDNLELNPN